VLTRALLTWLLMIGAEILHGALRTMFLVPAVGMHRAGQIGVFIGSALVLAIAWLTRRWRDGASSRALLGIGALWTGLTVVFEFAFGYYVVGYSIAYIAGDFNLLAGRLMLLGLLVMGLAPIIIARFVTDASPAAPR
jgi:hypothetical protein